MAQLEGQVDKMGQENAKFEENNKQLEAQIGQMKVMFVANFETF